MEFNGHRATSSLLHFCIITVVCLFSFFINNHVVPADIMEARNLATAQEMVTYGNYLLPTLNGEPRLEKPPLPTWIAAGIEHIFPDNLPVQRYAAGLSALLTVFFLYLLVVRLTGHRGAGLIAALVLATTINVMLMARTATWDIYTHSFMLGAIYFMVVAFTEKGAQWRYFLLTGLFIGLSFLSKGPISLYALLLPFLISYFIVYGVDMTGKKLAVTGMIMVGLVVSFWWYGYTYLFHSEFAVEVAQKEATNWLNYNVRPWYYYWQFAAEGGIWALFWLTAIVYFFLNKKTIFQSEYKFSFIWFFALLVLLSTVPEKKPRYLLPLLIPGAMLIGLYLHQMIMAMKTKNEKIVFQINATVISIVLLALPMALYFLLYKENRVSGFVQIVATASSWGLFVYIIKSLFGRNGIRPASVFIACILTMMMVASIFLIPISRMFLNEDRHSIRLLRDNKETAVLPFYYNDKENLRIELVYELNRRILKMNTDNDEAITNALPFVFISSESIEKIMSDKNVSIEYIGTFDNNWNKKGTKRYNPDFVKEAAIIRAK